MTVVDACIALKWFVEESDSDGAKRLISKTNTLVVPDLIMPEVCNAAFRKVRVGEMTEVQLYAVPVLLPQAIQLLVSTEMLAAQALGIARTLQHSVYDCFYLALAVTENTLMVTTDDKLLTKVEGTPWAQRCIKL